MCLWHDVKLRKTHLEVKSPNVTWRRDLWCHQVIVFLEMCQIVGWTAMANLAALRTAVFSLSAKNLRGADNRPPAVRGLNLFSSLIGGTLPAKMRFCYFQVIDLTSEVKSRPNLKVWYQRLCLMTNITFVFFLIEGGLNSEQQMSITPPRVLSRMAKLLVPERVKQHFFVSFAHT